jgi:hypothetical protein
MGLLLTLVFDWRSRSRVPLSPARHEYLERVQTELAIGESGTSNEEEW